MNIIDYIPYGKDNAISRKELPKVSNINDDRITRNEVETARANYAILNMQDGKGYFRPTEKERDLALRWKRQTEARICSLQKSLGGVNKFLTGESDCNIVAVHGYVRKKHKTAEPKRQIENQLHF